MSVTIICETAQPVDEHERQIKTLIKELFSKPSAEALSKLIDNQLVTGDRIQSLLWSACCSRNPDLVQLFLDRNISVLDTNDRGRNCLMYMAENQAYYGTIVNKLIEQGLSVNHQDRHGVTALMLFSCGQGLTGRKKGNITAVGHLIRWGADLYCEDDKGQTVLDYARNANKQSKRSSNQEIVNLLEGLMKPFLKLREIERNATYTPSSSAISAHPVPVQLADLSASSVACIGPRDLEKQIFEREGFNVRVMKNGKLVKSDCLQLKNYSRRLAPKGDLTVAAWKKLFKNRYPNYEIEILSGDYAAGNTLLRNVRI